MRKSLEERFWEKVAIPKHLYDCWIWTGTKGAKGAEGDYYGQIRNGRRRSQTHRLSWEIHRGPIPEGVHVLHKCDNPPCVNPNHLFLGVQRDNNLDCVAKGRNNIGERNGQAKLTKDNIKCIREMVADGSLQREVASLFHISRCHVSDIVNRKRWRHV